MNQHNPTLVSLKSKEARVFLARHRASQPHSRILPFHFATSCPSSPNRELATTAPLVHHLFSSVHHRLQSALAHLRSTRPNDVVMSRDFQCILAQFVAATTRPVWATILATTVGFFRSSLNAQIVPHNHEVYKFSAFPTTLWFSSTCLVSEVIFFYQSSSALIRVTLLFLLLVLKLFAFRVPFQNHSCDLTFWTRLTFCTLHSIKKICRNQSFFVAFLFFQIFLTPTTDPTSSSLGRVWCKKRKTEPTQPILNISVQFHFPYKPYPTRDHHQKKQFELIDIFHHTQCRYGKSSCKTHNNQYIQLSFIQDAWTKIMYEWIIVHGDKYKFLLRG